jgi:tetratricopeptide (TPR) repeat protein
MDIFISHNHRDMRSAVRLEGRLHHEGLSVWLDKRNIRAGSPLSPAIMEALNQSRNVVVLWSSASALSEWVQLEWTTVLNLNLLKETVVKRGIIACRLDDTPFPPLGTFLVNYPSYDLYPSFEKGLKSLLEGLKVHPAETPHLEKYRPPTLVNEIIANQTTVLEALARGDVSRAKAQQKKLDVTVKKALEEQPADRYVLALDGYNKKNKYLIRHWGDFQAMRYPKDALLDQASQAFLKVLASYPDDPSALNGIGSVLLLRGDLAGAEFYIGRALARAKEEHMSYGAAEQDLALVKHLRAEKRDS